MRHFPRDKWILYIRNSVDKAQKTEMEEHLVECPSCLEIYLAEIELSGMEHAEHHLSPQFTTLVMSKIKEENSTLKQQKNRRRFSHVFAYYVTAACITLVLMFSGVFNYLEDKMPQAALRFADSTKRAEEVLTGSRPEEIPGSGWPERLMNSTLDFFNTFKFKEPGGL